MNQTRFTGKSLEEALLAGALTSTGTKITGMVKVSEKEGHVAFTRSGCDHWIDLPVEMIEEAERVGSKRCKDHTHVVMSIVLRQAKTDEGKLLMAFLDAPTSQFHGDTRANPAMSTVAATAAMGSRPTFIQGGQAGPPQRLAPHPTMFRARPPFRPVGGGGLLFDPSNECCCPVQGEVCTSDGWCWPATYNVCMSCPFGDICECYDTGPACRPSPII